MLRVVSAPPFGICVRNVLPRTHVSPLESSRSANYLSFAVQLGELLHRIFVSDNRARRSFRSLTAFVYPRFAASKGTIVAWHSSNRRMVSSVDNLGLGGLFIRTPNPPATGTFIQLAARCADWRSTFARCCRFQIQSHVIGSPTYHDLPMRIAFQDNRCSPVAVSRAMRINDTITKTTVIKINATRA